MEHEQVEIGTIEVKPTIELLGKMGKSILVRFSHHGEYYINVKISNKSTMKEIVSLYETLTGDDLENIN